MFANNELFSPHNNLLQICFSKLNHLADKNIYYLHIFPNNSRHVNYHVLIKTFYIAYLIKYWCGHAFALFNRTRNKACMNDNLGFVVCKQTPCAVKNKHHIKLDSLKLLGFLLSTK